MTLEQEIFEYLLNPDANFTSPTIEDAEFYSKVMAQFIRIQESDQWISVEDGLPECHSQHGDCFASGCVLTYDKYGEMEVNQYIKVGKHKGSGWNQTSEYWESLDVTHWMPLPDPPNDK